MLTCILKENSLQNQELSLHPLHLEDLKRSGLSDETILRAGIRSVPPAEIRKLLGFEPKGLISAYVIPYHDSLFRLRCFYDEGVEGAKYLQRKNSDNRLYIPPILDRDTLKDADIPLYLTEGEKKALKAYQEGLPCVAVAGLWNWSDGSGELISDFDQIELKGRKVFIVPDNDWCSPNKNGYKKNLEQAVFRFSMKLMERGADVYLVELPKSEEKIGLDDYLCKHTVDEFLRLAIIPIIPNVEIFKNAQKILLSENPLDVIVGELSKSCIKRDKELSLCFLISLFPKLKENALVLITGETSVGKSTLVSTVLQAIPEANKLVIFSSSSKALLYRNKNLSGTVLWIGEFNGAVEIIELLKALISEKKAKHLTVNDTKRGKAYYEFDIEAEGLTIFVTSTKERFNEELENRSFVVNLKSDSEILDEVTRLLAKRANGAGQESCNFKVLQEVYRQIKPYKVEIPYAEEIQKYLQKNRPRIARDFSKILSLIKAHALLNQKHRAIKDGVLIASEEDYRAIFKLSNLILEAVSEIRSHHLQFLKACTDWVTRKEIALLLNKSERTVRQYISELRDYLEVDGKGSTQRIIATQIPEPTPPLPEPSNIFPLPNCQKPNSLENSNSYAGNMGFASFCQNAKIDQQEETKPQNWQIGNDWQNGFCQNNSLKDKEKMQIGKLATEIYISLPPDFWERANFDDIVTLED